MKKNFMLFVIVSIAVTQIIVQTVSAQNTSPFWSLAGNSNAAATSKLGTTNVIPLRLFTNNVERLRIQTNGRVGIGTTNPVNIFTVKATTGTPAASWVTAGVPVFVGFAEAASSEFYLASASNTADFRPVFSGKRSRGTLATPTAVVNNDYITSFTAAAYDGSSFLSPAAIHFYVDGTPSVGHVPARISFETGTSRSDRVERLKILNNGDFNFNNGQMFVRQSNGSVGIGTTDPTARLDLGDPVDNTAITFIKSGLNYGAYFSKTSTTSGVETIYSYNAGSGAGIYASSESGNGVSAASSQSIGVYGYTGNASSWAGYFLGKVYSSGGYTSSDRKLKKDITEVSDAMNIIKKLQPRHYQFRQDGNYKYMNLPQGSHYGLIAQDVEKVLPNLVADAEFNTAKLPELEEEQAPPRVAIKPGEQAAAVTIKPRVTKERKEEIISFKAMNYTELIPIMIKAMQEQQQQIDDQQQKIQRLNQQVSQLLREKNINSSLSNIILEQNSPNPYNHSTRIRYAIPSGFKTAQLVVTDITGKRIKQVMLTSGSGTVNLDGSLLSNGAYSYSLVIDGKIVETKTMLVAK